MDPNIQHILEPKETVAWEGMVNRKVIVMNFVIALAIAVAFGVFFLTRDRITYTSNEQDKEVSSALVGAAVLAIGVVVALLIFFSDMVRRYAITSKRVILKSGLIGTDFQSVYFDQIKNVIVSVGIIGKVFKVGSLKIDIGKTETYSTGDMRRGTGSIQTRTMYDVLKHIEQPYDVYKTLQQSLEGRKEKLYSGRADREAMEK